MPDQEKKSSSDATRRSSGALPPLRNPPLPSLPSLPPPATRAPAYPSSRAPAYPPSSALGYPSGAASAAGTGAQAGQSSPFSTFQPPATQSTMERPVELTSSLIPGREEEFRTHYQTHKTAMIATVARESNLTVQLAGDLCDRIYTAYAATIAAAQLTHYRHGVPGFKALCVREHQQLLRNVAADMNLTVDNARLVFVQIMRPLRSSWPDPFPRDKKAE